MADKTSTMKTKLEIDGERAYKEACQGINTSLKTLGSEMRLITATYADNAKGADALRAKQDVLQKTLSEQNKKVEEAEKALKQLKDAGFDDTNPTVQKFQQNLNNAKAEVAKTESQLNSINKELNSSKINWEAVGGAVAKGAKAFATGIAAIGAAAGAAATALAACTVSASNYADDVLTMSANTHIATDDLQAYSYALNFIDGDINTLTGTMKKNITRMQDAAQGNATYAAAYDKLGVSVTDANGQLRDSETVYWEVIDALGEIENTTERDAMAMEILGKSGTELNTIIDAGSEAFKGYAEEANEVGAVMSGENLAALGAFNDKLQTLKAGLSGLKNTAGLIALPFLDVLAGDGITILKDFNKGIQDANGDMGKMASVIGSTLADGINLLGERLPDFVDMGVQLITSLVDGLVQNIPAITQAATTIVVSLCDGLISMLPAMLDGAAQLIIGLAQGIGAALPQLLPKVVEVITALVQTLIDNIPMLIDAALQLILGLANGLIAAIPVLVEAIPQIITSLVNALLAAIPQIIQAGIQLLTALIGALPEIITTIVEALPQIIDGIITALLENIPLIIQAGIDLLVALIQALPEIITTIVGAIPQIIGGIVDALIGNIDKIIMAGVQLFIALIENLPTIIVEIVKAVPQIITGIVDAFTSLFPKIVEIGGNLLKGIWEGICAAGEWLKEKVTGFFSGIVDGIKGFLGIHSPSTVFSEIGDNMAAGIGVGFGDEMGAVGGDMQAAVGGAGAVTAQEAIAAINNGIISNVAQLDQAVNAIVERVLNSLNAQNAKFTNHGITIDKNLASGMVTGIAQITAKVPQITQSIITAFVAQNTKFTNQGIEMDKNIASGMVSGIPQITAKVPQIITPIVEAIRSFYQQFVNAGEYMVEGIWQGFQNMSGWLESKVRSMMRAIVRAVEQEMDINSPSKVFENIGEYMAAGIGVGFEAEMRKVEKSIRNAMPKEVLPETDPAPRPTPSGRIPRGDNGGGTAGGVQVVQNFYTEGNDYAKQQREAAKQFKLIAREIG